jgi:hypothetical protein
MEKNKIQELILRYNNQQATHLELAEIEQLLEQGKIELHELKDLQQTEDKFMALESLSPSVDLDDQFYQMLALETKARKSFSWNNFFSWPEVVPKLALASVTLLIGLTLGYFLRPTAVVSNDTTQMATLSKQVTDLKEMMMLSLLEKESASDRLKAVSLTEDMEEVSSKVTTALLQTLNHDANVNVRLAALDALKPYVKMSNIREALIRSIAKQNSPLVQVSLAELMGQLQERSSVKEFEKIIQSDKTPDDVKKRIKKSIEVLI